MAPFLNICGVKFLPQKHLEQCFTRPRAKSLCDSEGFEFPRGTISPECSPVEPNNSPRRGQLWLTKSKDLREITGYSAILYSLEGPIPRRRLTNSLFSTNFTVEPALFGRLDISERV